MLALRIPFGNGAAMKQRDTSVTSLFSALLRVATGTVKLNESLQNPCVMAVNAILVDGFNPSEK